MNILRKIGLLGVTLLLTAVLYVLADFTCWWCIPSYDDRWIFSLTAGLYVLQELLRTYWRCIHTGSTSFLRGACYLLVHSIALSIICCAALLAWAITANMRASRSNPKLPELLAVLAAVIAFAAYHWAKRTFQFPMASQHIRGRTLTSFAKAQKAAINHAKQSETTIHWGGLELPDNLTEGHFAVIGSTGSGKTATLTQLMKAVLPRVGEGQPSRALIYDAKRDILSVLKHIGVPAERIRILNPFDARSDAWDMARDITSPSTTSQLASILIPQNEGPNRFFSDAARAILAGVMDAFILANNDTWTLRDVVLAMQDHDRLKQILSMHPGTSGLVGEYFNRKDTLHDVRSTIASYMATLKPIAALWSRSTRKVSLEEWSAGQFILVLGNDDSLRAPLDALNRVLFQRMSEILTRKQDTSNGRTWIFLDELKEAGRLNGLARLMTKGRSFGVRVVIGFQDISGLSTVYGDNGAREIADLPMNKAILRLDSMPTAMWAAQLVGEAEVRQFRVTTTSDGESFAEQVFNRTAVLASELTTLPLPDAQGYHGVFIAPALGVYKAKVPYGMPKPKPDPAIDFQARPPKEQYLDSWTQEDIDRLRLSPPTTESFEQPSLPFVEAEPHDPGNLMPRLTRDVP